MSVHSTVVGHRGLDRCEIGWIGAPRSSIDVLCLGNHQFELVTISIEGDVATRRDDDDCIPSLHGWLLPSKRVKQRPSTE